VAFSGEESNQSPKPRSPLGENRNRYRVLAPRQMGLRLGQIAVRSAQGTVQRGRHPA